MKFIEKQIITEGMKIPSFKAGDTVTIYYKIKEGGKERILSR